MSDTRVGLQLDPLDTLFFRDGRPFDSATRVAGGLPTPQPLTGALRTALLNANGFDLAAYRQARRQQPEASDRSLLLSLGAPAWILDLRFRGPWLALYDDRGIDPLLPVPVNLSRDDTGAWLRADPLEGAIPGWTDADGLRPLWRKGQREARPPGGFLTPAGIQAYLKGSVPRTEDWFESQELHGLDQRVGVGIEPDALTSVAGLIYAISLLVLRPRIDRPGKHLGKRIGFYAEVLGAESAQLAGLNLVPLGGEGRYVQVTQRLACSWPTATGGRRTVHLLASPAFLPGKRPLPDLSPNRLVAAGYGSAQAFSGWDIARGGPRATRFAVPAGGVFYSEGDQAHDRESLCPDEEDTAQGWGFALRGIWHHG